MTKLLSDWKEKAEKLGELEDWLGRAIKEVKLAPPGDPRWTTYNEVYEAAERLKEEIREIEERQEAALTEHLSRVGPVTFTVEGGEKRTVSTERRTAGGNADLLPAELLAIWRVASVFQGSVVTEGQKRLTFGDAEQIVQFKTKRKGRR